MLVGFTSNAMLHIRTVMRPSGKGTSVVDYKKWSLSVVN